MKIKNISKNNLSFPLKKKTGQKIVVVIRPDEFVFSEDDSKKTENQQLIIYERKKLIQIAYMDKPEEMEYYKSYSETIDINEVEYFNPSLDIPVDNIPSGEIEGSDITINPTEDEIEDESEIENEVSDEDLMNSSIWTNKPKEEAEIAPIEFQENPISPIIDKLKEDMMNAIKVPNELLKSPLDNGPTMEFTGGLRENINTTDTPEVTTVDGSTEPKPKHAGGRPKGVKNKPTDKSKKKKDHRKNWKFLKK